MFKLPVLMLVFNRIETTQKVFEQLRKVKPFYLYVVADGARANKAGEAEKCEAVRQLFLTQIDWPCELQTLYRGENWGCRRSVAAGISWFFERVEAGIILEDDCVPEPSFFNFCQEMLNKYSDNSQIMHISGSQLLPKSYENQPDAYLYACIPYIWGWATWRRAWLLYEADMQNWPNFEATRWAELADLGAFLKQKFRKNMNLVHQQKLDTWDFQWTFSLWQHKGISIVPNRNLISNVGFGADATHTATVSHLANLPTAPINSNLKPLNILPANFEYDRRVFLFVYGQNIFVRAWRWLKNKLLKN